MTSASDCIFCKVIAKEIPCYKIREDDNFLAFLDIFPSYKGQTLVIPKKHHDSDIFLQDDELIKNSMIASKKVAQLLKRNLKAERIGIVVEWLGVHHLHIKLYPMFWIKNGTNPVPKEKKQEHYFETYPGYLTTEMGKQADHETLFSLQQQITWAKTI